MIQKFKTLAKDSFTYSIGIIISNIIGFFLIPVYTRIFNPEQFGTIDILISISGFLLIFLVFGTDSSLTRYFYESDDVSYRKKIISTVFLFRIFLGICIIAICMLSVPLLDQLLFEESLPALYYYIIFTAAFFGVLLAVTTTVYRLLMQPKLYIALTILQSFLSPIFIIFFTLVLELGIFGYLLGYFLAILILCALSCFLLREYLSFEYSPQLLKKVVKFAIPLVPASISIWIISFSDRFFLIQFAGLAVVGLYAAGSKISLGIGLLTSAFRLSWTPYAQSIVKQSDARGFFRLVSLAYIVGLSFMIIILTGLSTLIMQILTTPAYYEGYIVVGILAYSAVFYGFYTISSLGTWFAEKNVFFTLAIVVSAISNIFLNFLLIPLFGMIGAASATLCANIIGNVIVIYFGERVFPIGFDFKRISATVLITLICMSVELYLLGSNLPAMYIYSGIFCVWIAVGFFFLYGIIGRRTTRKILSLFTSQ